MQPNSIIRIIIVDDSAIFRDGMKTLLRKQKHLVNIIGEAENGKEAIDLVEKLMPQIVFLDVQMPVMEGIEACKIIKKNFPSIGIIALSTFNEKYMVLDMVEAGANGYLLKNTTLEEVLKAINLVHEGGTYFAVEVSKHLVKEISERNNLKIKRPELSAREKEIVKLICAGQCNKEIASTLGLSKRTIDSYRENILDKLEARNSADVIIYAIKNNIYKL